ncbi:MAG: TldD/PmbA family protein [Candidatus Nanohaloarchaeota archaeon QJJ-5]|nr:TldD/PmbA family protein [Candidatus Nanohaloarchaeota archaeon QJJ-5]
MFDTIDDAFECSGYDQLEVYAETENTIEATVSDGNLDSVQSDTSKGVGVRALVDNTVGFAYTTDPARVRDTAQRAIKLARLSQFEQISFPVAGTYPSIPGLFDEETADLTQADIAEQLNTAVSAHDTAFPEGQVARTTGTSYIRNSAGMEAKQDETYFVSYLSANAHGRSKYWFDAARSRFDVSAVANEAVDLVEAYDETEPMNDGVYDIVLTPFAQYQIFSGILYPAFNADRVQRGKSHYEGMKGEKVASEGLSIIDDRRKEEGVRSRPFDREGTPAQRTTLIDDGVLSNFLYDIQRAEKESVESTGNASGGYKSFPTIEPSNITLEGSQDSLTSPDDTVVIHSVSGVHTANETSGDFSLNLDTAYRGAGKDRVGLEGGLFVGNVFELLESFAFFTGDRRTIDSLTTRPAVFKDQKLVN